MKHKQAFTLIELLVVVLIIGILAAVALPQYQKAVTKSKLGTLKPLVRSIANAAEVYYLTTNTWPQTFDELDVDIPTPIEFQNQDYYYFANYPWGYCVLAVDSTQQFVLCRDTTAHIGYTQYLSGTTQYTATHACSSIDNDPIAEKVCQQETGKAYPYYTDTEKGTKVFAYENRP